MKKKYRKYEDKLAEEQSKYKVYCKCGHSVVIYPINKTNRKLCSWCGNYVYKDPEEQKKYDFKCKLRGLL